MARDWFYHKWNSCVYFVGVINILNILKKLKKSKENDIVKGTGKFFGEI